MPRLILMRHAKSSWKSDAKSDHARPLNKRGKRDAPLMGAWLKELSWSPEMVLSSDSRRTKETYDGMSQYFNSPTVFWMSNFYHGGISNIRSALMLAETLPETVMLLGHNPGWEMTLTWLSGSDETMTTGNAALLKSDNWNIGLSNRGNWTLESLLRPKER